MNTRQILIGIVMFFTIIFWVDPMIVDSIMSMLRLDMQDHFIRLIVWGLLLYFTLAFTIFLSMYIGAVIGRLLGGKDEENTWGSRLKRMQEMQRKKLELDAKREERRKKHNDYAMDGVAQAMQEIGKP